MVRERVGCRLVVGAEKPEAPHFPGALSSSGFAEGRDRAAAALPPSGPDSSPMPRSSTPRLKEDVDGEVPGAEEAEAPVAAAEREAAGAVGASASGSAASAEERVGGPDEAPDLAPSPDHRCHGPVDPAVPLLLVWGPSLAAESGAALPVEVLQLYDALAAPRAPDLPLPPRLPPSVVGWGSRTDREDPAVVAGLSAPERPDRQSPGEDWEDVPVVAADGEAWPAGPGWAKDCGAPVRRAAP